MKASVVIVPRISIPRCRRFSVNRIVLGTTTGTPGEWRPRRVSSVPRRASRDPEPRASTLYEPVTYAWPTETILVSHNGRTKLLHRTSLQADHGQGVKTSCAIIITVRDLHCVEPTVTTLLHNMIIRMNCGLHTL